MSRLRDEFGDRVKPRKGFVYPNIGDKITALKDYETLANNSERFVRAGDVGVVTGIRKPGSFKDESGYIGLIVEFDRVKKSYSAGFVMRWDAASDPTQFSISPPSPEELKAKADENLRSEEEWRQCRKRLENEFGDKSDPQPGFIFPDAGDKIVAVKDYETSASSGERYVRKGDVGTITGLRMPHTFDKEHGHIGLIVHFDRVAKSYSAGFVLQWDVASDPLQFSIPVSVAMAVRREEQIYAEAQAGTGEAFKPSKPLSLRPKTTA